MPPLLVIRLSALGDVIHTLPAVVAMKEALGGLQIGWAVEAPYADLVATVAGVEAIPVSMRRWGRAPLQSRGEIRAALATLRAYGETVDFQGLIKSGALAFLSRAPVRWGFDREAVRERAALLFTNRPVSIDRRRHVVEWNLQLASALCGRPLTPASLDFSRFSADPDGRLEPFRNHIVLLPGAGKLEKQWPTERFRTLARSLTQPVTVVWGPGEETLAREVGAPMAPATSLRELASLLRGASVVVGADTGPLHLAAALGTPVVGLYGPTDPRRNGPYGQASNVISTHQSTRTMNAIRAEVVAEIVAERLR